MATSSQLRALLRAAARVRANAHAPYSRFRVGAAVLADGRIHAGCNVENGAYPLSVCAERNAVAAAVAAGATRIDAVAVVGGLGRPSAPCGGCRQVLSEFCGTDAAVVCATPEGLEVRFTVGELLPHAFGARDLSLREPAATRTRRAGRSGSPGNGRTGGARARDTRTSGRSGSR